MKPHLEYVIALDDGLVAAIKRDYVTNNLHKRVSMDRYIKDILSFSISASGSVGRTLNYGVSSIAVNNGINRIARDLLRDIKGLSFLEIGYLCDLGGYLQFHVYTATFNEAGQWQ